jgi:hypothetical protein
MERDDEWKDDLKDFSLGESGKRNFQAPEGYFDRLPDSVLQRWLKENHQPVTKHIGLRKMIAVAAIVTGLYIGVTLLSKQQPGEDASTQIKTAEAYQYVFENIEDFAPLMLDSHPQAEATDHQTPQQAAPDALEANELEEYLLEEMESEDFESLF